jgi:hypothetical protein
MIQPPAMRIKSRWFSGDGSAVRKSAAEQGGAMAFIAWRVAVQMVKRLRAAKFDVDAGTPYFVIVQEVLVFACALADRIAFLRLSTEERAAFVVALVRHVARHLQDNADDLLGPPAPGAASHADRFVDLFNELSPHYAEFDGDPAGDDRHGFTPGFAALRYLGRRLEPALPEHDRRWLLDQVMATEAPEAIDIVQRSMRELFDPQPRPSRRASLAGE